MTDTLREALDNLDEVWAMKNTTLPENDLTLPLVVRNFIATVRATRTSAAARGAPTRSSPPLDSPEAVGRLTEAITAAILAALRAQEGQGE